MHRPFSDEVYWMGLTDEKIEGVWVYYDTQTKPNFTDWDWNQPNDLGHHEDCARFDNRLGADYKWNDDSCNALHEPICEIRYVFLHFYVVCYNYSRKDLSGSVQSVK